MKAELKYQKLLMETALSCLEGIEFAEKTNDGFVKELLQNKYSTTMATLAGELASIGKVTDIIHDSIPY